MTAFIDNGRLVVTDDYPATATDEYNNGRLDAHLFPQYAAKEAARIEQAADPSFAERHWRRGVRSVIPA